MGVAADKRDATTEGCHGDANRAGAEKSTEQPMTQRAASLTRIEVPWRWLLLLALLCLALVTALPHGSSSTPAADAPAGLGATSHHGLSSLPLSAQLPVSARLGADDPAYTMRSSAGGAVQAGNHAQRLSARFTAAGVEVATVGMRFGLSLQGVGYGGALEAIHPVAPAAHGNAVVYAHPQLSEWYVNGPLGLEQGFTVARPQDQPAAGPLTLSVALSGDAHASLTNSGRSLDLSRPGAAALRYGGLFATDARGRTLHSWLALEGGHVLLRVATKGASYPLRIDPTIIQSEPEQKLTASDEAGDGLFGYSVALSADGNTALIGGPRDSTHFGAVWVFVRSHSTWTQQGSKLVGSEAGGEGGEHCGVEGEEGDECSFGRSVALSADGNTALIGSSRDSRFQPAAGEEPGRWVPNVGAAWVFTRSGAAWTQQGAKLTASEEAGEGRFGKSVALSSDGNTALIGGSSDLAGHGGAWVFTRSQGGWKQGAKLTGAEEKGEAHFGGSVALSGDGDIALIGGPGDASFKGAAWVFTRTSPAAQQWTEQGAKLTANGESAEGHFGYRVALSSDGSTALIGARADSYGAAETQGAAWVFTNSGAGFGEQAQLTGPGDAGEEFGSSVALSSDGSVALVGAPHASGQQGAASLFQRSGSGWTGGQRLPAIAAQGRNWFGFSVALSSDAKTALVGGPNEAVGRNVKAGAVWAYGAEPHPLVKALSPKEGPAAGGTTVTISGTNFQEVIAVRFGAADARAVTVNSRNQITALSPPGVGVVDVTVTTVAGTSAFEAGDRFTYTTAPPPLSKPPPKPPPKPSEPGSSTTSAGGGATAGASPAAAGGVLAFGQTGGGAVCRVSLVGRGFTVNRHGRAIIKLISTGPGTCVGKVKLLVKVRVSKRRLATKTIAAGGFSVAAGKPAALTLKLNAAGRALLGRRHGRLTATLAVFRASPLPAATLQSASVRLTLQKSVRKGAAPKK
jgi:hypothetical protein